MEFTNNENERSIVYRIPCVWQNHGCLVVKAMNLKDAIVLAQERGELPQQSEYIEDSFEIDFDGVGITYPNEACLWNDCQHES